MPKLSNLHANVTFHFKEGDDLIKHYDGKIALAILRAFETEYVKVLKRKPNVKKELFIPQAHLTELVRPMLKTIGERHHFYININDHMVEDVEVFLPKIDKETFFKLQQAAENLKLTYDLYDPDSFYFPPYAKIQNWTIAQTPQEAKQKLPVLMTYLIQMVNKSQIFLGIPIRKLNGVTITLTLDK